MQLWVDGAPFLYFLRVLLFFFINYFRHVINSFLSFRVGITYNLMDGVIFLGQTFNFLVGSLNCFKYGHTITYDISCQFKN